MAKKIKLPFKEQISGIINKLVNIDRNSSDSIFLHYYHGSWEASLYVGGYEADKESIDLIGDDFVRMDDERMKERPLDFNVQDKPAIIEDPNGEQKAELKTHFFTKSLIQNGKRHEDD